MACKHTKGGAAPGTSGLTWQMIEHWSDEIVTHVYNLLIAIHAEGSSPAHWAWKWLSPVPKVTHNITTKDLRPLSLIEVLRKLWNGLQDGRYGHSSQNTTCYTTRKTLICGTKAAKMQQFK